METDVFRAFSPEQRMDFDKRYMAHLLHRDGTPYADGRKLSKREKTFEDLESRQVRWQGSPLIDPEVFKDNQARRQPDPNLDEATLWALALAKSNRLESYGINYAFSHLDRGGREQNDPLTYIEAEEDYHTRALGNALDVLGLEMCLTHPPLTTRLLLKSMIRIPKPISYMVILCTEIAGVGAFSMLRDKGYELLGEQPEASEQLDKWLQQILVDEVCHVNYARSKLGPVRLQAAEKILPVVALGLIDDMPEYKMLFGDELMDRILAADVNSAVEMYNDRFVPNYTEI